MKLPKDQTSDGSDHNRYAAIYARVSTEDQGKGFSIPTQKEACQKLAAHEGYTVPECHVLVDEGISGTTMDRPGLRQLRDLVAAQAITAIIVYDPDRLSRNLGHQLLLAEEMERAAVKLLNGRRVLKPGIWQPSSVHRMLTNEAYAGRTYFGKYKRTSKTTQRLRPREEWIAIQVPPILDEATFQAAQAQLARNRELSPRNKKREYLLRGGHLCCGRCGRAMTGAAYRNIRVYRCSSMGQVLDPDGRCYGQIKADDVEPKVWAAVEYLLEHPEIIAEQVRRQQDTADDQRAEIQQDLALIETALAKCDREARRWADAYAQEVINLAELKGYRAEIETSRQSLLTEQAAKQAKLEGIEQAMEQVGPLTAYCKQVRQELPRFDDAEKRLALEWLGIRAIWRPGEWLEIHANIPTDQIVPIAS
jgi:Resolvase, N terminal domain/Recombinase/Recombinase zinc beta ribbon domain